MACCDSKYTLEMESVNHKAHSRCVYPCTFKMKFSSVARFRIIGSCSYDTALRFEWLQFRRWPKLKHPNIIWTQAVLWWMDCIYALANLYKPCVFNPLSVFESSSVPHVFSPSVPLQSLYALAGFVFEGHRRVFENVWKHCKTARITIITLP